MIEGYGPILGLLCLLQFKHMLADYFLQSKIMLDGRAQYIHLGRFLHAGVHAAGSMIAFLVVGSPLLFVILVCAVEWIVHFHIDWWKGRVTFDRKLTPADAAYWRASGIDQALHQLTYVVMIGWWIAVQNTT